MSSKETYEEQIVEELHALPQAALKEVLCLIGVVREKYGALVESSRKPRPVEHATHERTRQLLTASRTNWAHDLIRDREDRL